MKSKDDRYAWSVKIGEKGQFVIPKEARDLFNIKPGDTLLVLGDKERGLAIPPKGTFAELAQHIFSTEGRGDNDK